MIITKASNTTIFFDEIEYKFLVQWLKDAHHITAPRAARFIICNQDPVKAHLELGVSSHGHGYQLSENSGSSKHPWRISFPNTQLSSFGYFNRVPLEATFNPASQVISLKINKELLFNSTVAEPGSEPLSLRTRKPKEEKKKEEENFEPKVIVDVPIGTDRSMSLADFTDMVQDLNAYLKANPAIVVQIKNNRIVYLISNE